MLPVNIYIYFFFFSSDLGKSGKSVWFRSSSGSGGFCTLDYLVDLLIISISIWLTGLCWSTLVNAKIVFKFHGHNISHSKWNASPQWLLIFSKTIPKLFHTRSKSDWLSKHDKFQQNTTRKKQESKYKNTNLYYIIKRKIHSSSKGHKTWSNSFWTFTF